MEVMIQANVENDPDVLAALVWLASTTGDAPAFFARLQHAQNAYRQFTSCAVNRGQDLAFSDLGPDIVAAYFAQAKSLLDDRRTYDLALASRTVPWVKQLGRNVRLLDRIEGASERAARMLSSESVLPDSAIFELVMASNYAADGLEVAFVDEAKGQGRMPDLKLSSRDLPESIYVECKRLGQGRYEQEERVRHKQLFRNVAELIDARGISVHIEVTYTRELSDVPGDYLSDHLLRALSSRIYTPAGYPWKDEFGEGVITPANVAAVRADTRDSSLYFGTKLARLLSGRVVREMNYHLAAGADPDSRDPRYIDRIHYGSVITWECIAPRSVEKKSRYVKSKLVEADRQLQGKGVAITHMAMDAELACESSDRRRALNYETITTFRPTSSLVAVFVHYLVPRISENHSWVLDETVDSFAPTRESISPVRIFPDAALLDNDLPAWKQRLSPR